MSGFSLDAYLLEHFSCSDATAFRLAGIDEVGLGAFAGPLVAAAVVLPHHFSHPLLQDSKTLSAMQREKASQLIYDSGAQIQIFVVDVPYINRHGIRHANVHAFSSLVEALPADGYCLDGILRFSTTKPVHSLPKADALVPAVSAASIVAKVYRDNLMEALHEVAPEYGWRTNKGYGSAAHRRAIQTLGPHAEHRDKYIRKTLAATLQMPLFEDDE